ncbi:MAG: hypothetical protein JNJ83_24305 [Verrucomicrobiaceae bacterium]|nr:hypothetical protein [Verrucomicrobiaceae bacterium]
MIISTQPNEDDPAAQLVRIEVTGKYEFGLLSCWLDGPIDREPSNEIAYGPILIGARIECYARAGDEASDWRLVNNLQLAVDDLERPWMTQGRDGLQRLYTCEVKRDGIAELQFAGNPEIRIAGQDIEVNGRRSIMWRQSEPSWHLDLDPFNSETWFFVGQPFVGNVATIFEPPMGLTAGEWGRLVWACKFVQEHTMAPTARFLTPAEALSYPDHSDYVQWLAMLPEDDWAYLGVLPETSDWRRTQQRSFVGQHQLTTSQHK